MCKCNCEILIKEPEIKLEEVIKRGPFYIATVSLVDDSTAKGVGISKCSASDKFSWSKGKIIAEGRARKSLLRKFYGELKNKVYEG